LKYFWRGCFAPTRLLRSGATASTPLATPLHFTSTVYNLLAVLLALKQSDALVLYSLLLPVSVFWRQNYSFSALTLSVGRLEGHPACKKLEWWGAGVVICLERGADLHMPQLMPLTDSCFSQIQIGFTLLVPAHPGSPGKRAVKRVCVCVCVFWRQEVQGAHKNTIR